MILKYKWHRKMMIWTRFFIVLYSVLVFFFLVHFHHVEYYINWNLVLLLILIFWICFFSFSVWGTWSDFFWSSVDKSVSSVAFILVVIAVLVWAFAWLFCYDIAPIEQVFLIFVIFIWLYFVLCFLDRRTITRNTLLFIYFIFYFLFLSPVLFQVVSDLWIFWKIWNFLFWMSPMFLIIFRTTLVDFLGSWFFIRKFFLKKDSEIWNCPQCHCHIIKKPFRFCPHCWNDKCGSSMYCESCWFSSKIRDFDFPNYCPHCGLSFRKRKARE